jgi:hypothetical protein
VITLSRNQRFVRQLVVDNPGRTAIELQDLACEAMPQGGWPKVNSALSYLKAWGFVRLEKDGSAPGVWYNIPGNGFDARTPAIPRNRKAPKTAPTPAPTPQPVSTAAVLTFTAQVQFSDGTKVALTAEQFKELKEILSN